METEEVNIKDLEDEFWNVSPSGSSDYIKLTEVRQKNITAIRLKAYQGMKLTQFKGEGKENAFRPNFLCEVIRGDNKGKEYVVSFSKTTAESLVNELKTKDFKAWENQILTVTIKQKGKFEGIDYSVYVAL